MHLTLITTAASQFGTWFAKLRISNLRTPNIIFQRHIKGNMSQLEKSMFTPLECTAAPVQETLLYSLTPTELILRADSLILRICRLSTPDSLALKCQTRMKLYTEIIDLYNSDRRNLDTAPYLPSTIRVSTPSKRNVHTFAVFLRFSTNFLSGFPSISRVYSYW